MKKIYLLLSVFFFSACSKDFLKPYDDRIIGTWHIADINRIGFGGSSSDLPFAEGVFTFNKDASLLYSDAAGNVYNGSWNIEKRTINGDIIRTLYVTAIDFNSQSVRTAFYDEMKFRSTNHFVAKVNHSFRTLVTHFRR